MKISREKPLLYWILRIIYKINWEIIIISWGDTVYSKCNIPPDFIIHEQTHLKRQKFSKIYGLWWWWRYIRNQEFRLNEELVAYQNQWKFIQKTIKDRNQRSVMLDKLANALSGKIYGNIIDVYHARKMIQK